MRMPAWGLLRSYILFAIPMLGSLGIGCLSINIDQVMVKGFAGNDASGNYYIVSRISTALLGISLALITIVMPTASAMFARGERGGVARLLRQSERFLSMMIAFPAMGMFVFAEEIMLIFGADFTGIAPAVMRAFALITFLYAVNRPLNCAAIITNRPWIDFHVTMVLAGANVLLNLVLIPQSLFGIRMVGMGALGSAVGTATLGFVGFAISRIVARLLLGVRTYGRITLHVAAAAAVGAACWLAKPFLLTGGRLEILARTAALGLVACAAYLGALWLVKEFSARDFRMILGMVSPAKMKEQFAEELFRPQTKQCAAERVPEPVEV
jgi:O-antigen/teichoic acid export membrane protein